MSVWCLAADMNAKGRLVWYLPYIFTDSQPTVSTGREIFGYSKQLGYFDADYPTRLGDVGGTTTVSGVAIDPFGPTSGARICKMFSVTRTAGAAVMAAPPSPLGAVGVFGSLLPEDLGQSGHRTGPWRGALGDDHRVGLVAAGHHPDPDALDQGLRQYAQGAEDDGRLGVVDLRPGPQHDPGLPQAVPRHHLPDQGVLQAVVEAPITFHLAPVGYQQLDPSFSP